MDILRRNLGDIDLLEELPFDTFLSVKMRRKEGRGTLFVNYIIPKLRKSDGTFREYGDLVTYFSKQDRFIFARGFILEEDSNLWIGQKQYFYFSKTAATKEAKVLDYQLFHSKKKQK